MQIIDYLKTHTFGQLIEEHGVFVSISNCKKKISLNYGQIEASKSDIIAQECRGLILAKKDYSEISIDDSSCPGEMVVIAHPFNRFFNLGQEEAAKLNWQDPNLKCFLKLDGTLCIVYFCPIKQEWHVATRSVPEANLNIDAGNYTFRTLFEKALEVQCKMSFKE